MKKEFKEKQAPRPDAVELLTEDHKYLKKLFREYQLLVETDDANYIRKDAVAQEACDLLQVHARLEEEIFYPAAAKALHDPELIAEARVEHGAAKELITLLQKTPVDDNIFDARFIVLGEIMSMHFKKEEHELFARAREAKMDLAGLARKMEELRDSIELTKATETVKEMGAKKKPEAEIPAEAGFMVPPPGFR